MQLPVTITDTQGKAVEGLEASDFLILDNGVTRRVTVDTIGTGVAPIALAVAVQGSGLSAAAVAKVQKVGTLIQPLVTGESGCAALLTFSAQVRWLQECTDSPDALDKAFRKLRPGNDAPQQAPVLKPREWLSILQPTRSSRRLLPSTIDP